MSLLCFIDVFWHTMTHTHAKRKKEKQQKKTLKLTCFEPTRNNHVQCTSLKLLPGVISVCGKGQRDRFPSVRPKENADVCAFVK